MQTISPGSPFDPGRDSPISPFMPGRPGRPSRPCLPLTPTMPFSPLAPANPGSPGWPAWPSSPRGPLRPGRPLSPAWPAKPGWPGICDDCTKSPRSPLKPGGPGRPGEPGEPCASIASYLIAQLPYFPVCLARLAFQRGRGDFRGSLSCREHRPRLHSRAGPVPLGRRDRHLDHHCIGHNHRRALLCLQLRRECRLFPDIRCRREAHQGRQSQADPICSRHHQGSLSGLATRFTHKVYC